MTPRPASACRSVGPGVADAALLEVPPSPSLVEAGGAWPVTTIRRGLPWWRV
jgi:hypothetical protein